MLKATSRLNTNTLAYTWTIENYTWFKNVNFTMTVESPIITLCNENNKYQFQLLIQNRLFNHYCGLYVMLKSLSKPYIGRINIKLSILRSNGTEFRSTDLDFCISKELHDLINIKNDEFFKGYLDDYLKLRCVFSKYNGVVSMQSETTNLKAAIAQSKISLLNDFEKLLNSDKFSDVTLVVGDKKFSAHKIILCTRSPVFSAMFECAMLENKTSIVNITDIEPEIMDEILSFIYSSKVKNTNKLTSDLFYAAEKYQLEDLMHLCEEAFLEKLDLDNLEEILKIVDKFDTLRRLRDATLAYLSVKGKAFFQWEKFDTVMKALSPSLKLEVTNAMFS